MMFRRLSKDFKELVSEVKAIRNADQGVEQFIASMVASLQILRVHKDLMSGLPTVRHAFPFSLPTTDAERSAQTTNELVASLETECRHTAKALGCEDDDLLRRVVERAEAFAKIRVRSRAVPPWSPTRAALPTRAIDQVMRDSPTFNTQLGPATLEQMKGLVASEGLEVFLVPGMRLFSACALYRDRRTSKEQYGIFMREDLHPSQHAFLIGHEFGHWWMHLGRGRTPNSHRPKHYLADLLETEFSPLLETQADLIALVALFPTPYLTWRSLAGELTPGSLYDQFMEQFSDAAEVSDELKQTIKVYIRRRIDIYQNFKTHFQSEVLKFRLPVSSIPVDSLDGLCVLLDRSESAWAVLDDSYHLLDCGPRWASLLGRSWHTLRATSPHIVWDLTVEELHNEVRRQLEKKRSTRDPTFFVTQFCKEVQSARTPLIAIHAIPVVSGNDYIGSLGVGTPFSRQVRSDEPDELHKSRLDSSPPAVAARLLERWRKNNIAVARKTDKGVRDVTSMLSQRHLYKIIRIESRQVESLGRRVSSFLKEAGCFVAGPLVAAPWAGDGADSPSPRYAAQLGNSLLLFSDAGEGLSPTVYVVRPENRSSSSLAQLVSQFPRRAELQGLLRRHSDEYTREEGDGGSMEHRVMLYGAGRAVAGRIARFLRDQGSYVSQPFVSKDSDNRTYLALVDEDTVVVSESAGGISLRRCRWVENEGLTGGLSRGVAATLGVESLEDD